MGMDVNVKVLVDDVRPKAGLDSEHGLSLWIEYKEKRILFDTGQSDILLQNAKKIGVDLTRTDVIILSHGHYDHTGGLCAVLKVVPDAVIYAHPAAVEPKYSCKEGKVRPIGMSALTRQAINNHKIVWTEKPFNLCEGITLTGQIPRKSSFEDVGGAFFIDKNCRKPDNLLDDQALFIESSKGLVVVLGCAHSGIVNTLDYISRLTHQSKIYAIIGGMHLVDASDDRIRHTIEALKRYDIEKIVPLHCTGTRATEFLFAAFGDKCVRQNLF